MGAKTKYIGITNKNVRENFKKMMLESMEISEIKRYFEEFKGKEIDFNIFQYGCLDCYDYDLYKTLIDCGLDVPATRKYTQVLDSGCTDEHREAIRYVYKMLVRNCTLEIIKDSKNGLS